MHLDRLGSETARQSEVDGIPQAAIVIVGMA